MVRNAALRAFERSDSNLSACPVAGILAVGGIAALTLQRESKAVYLIGFHGDGSFKTAAGNAPHFVR